MSAPLVILPDCPAPPAPLGLIAAGGRLPILVAQGMKHAGHTVHCIGLAGQYEEELPELCDDFTETGALKLGSWGKALRKFGVGHAVMVGRVDKAKLMHDWSTLVRNTPDLRSGMMWFKLRKDRRSGQILAAVADELAKDGVLLIDSTSHIQEHLAQAGVMTRRQPSAGQKADIDFAWPLLQELLRLDIGQAISVRERDTIAVEAVEGTDRMILRTGELCSASGWSLLKGARSGHDRRSDVPTVGPDTIRNLHEAGGRCLALAAGDVIIIDKPDTLAMADKLDIAIVGMPSA